MRLNRSETDGMDSSYEAFLLFDFFLIRIACSSYYLAATRLMTTLVAMGCTGA